MESRGQFIKALLPNGASIQIEVTSSVPGDIDVAAVLPGIGVSLDDVSAAIQGVAELIAASLVAVKPKKAVAEFAIELGVETGKLTALWVKGSGKANVKILLEWTSS